MTAPCRDRIVTFSRVRSFEHRFLGQLDALRAHRAQSSNACLDSVGRANFISP